MAYLHLYKYNQVAPSRYCIRKKGSKFLCTLTRSVSRTSRELHAITMAFSLPAFKQPIRSRVWSAKIWPTVPNFLRDFWSGPILANDDIREHMGEDKNGPDRRLRPTSFCENTRQRAN